MVDIVVGPLINFCDDSDSSIGTATTEGVGQFHLQTKSSVRSYDGLDVRELRLFQAIKEHDIEDTRALLAAGADVNCKDRRGDTPLIVAVENVDRPIIRILLRLPDIDINIQNMYGDTPLSIAVFLRQLKLVRMLLRAGGDVNARLFSGRSLLHEAAFVRHIEMVKLLIHYGAEVNVYDSFGRTPLQVAVLARPFPKLVGLLLRKGAEVDMVNDQGMTLLLHVCLSATTPKDNAIVRMLIANGADVNYKDPYAARTALHMAIIHGNISLVKLLVKNGANPTELFHGMYPPDRLAAIHGFFRLAKYLQRKVKQINNP